MQVKSKIAQYKDKKTTVTQWLQQKGFKPGVALDCQNECQGMKVCTAKQLLALGIDLKTIGKATGLSPKKLKDFKSDN